MPRVRSILATGADPMEKDAQGLTAIDLAERKQLPRITEALCEAIPSQQKHDHLPTNNAPTPR